MSFFHEGAIPALDSDGNPISGATWNFYLEGTLTAASVYSDSDLTTPVGSTVTSNAAGRFANIYYSDAIVYRAILKDAGGATIKDIDPVNETDPQLRAELALTTGAALVGANDGAIGANFTTVAGFIARLLSSAGASTIGFIQSGVNAIAETLQVAVRREVWADQYIQPGDTDDTLCITRAVTALLAAGGGGVVRLSRRTYTLNAGMTFTGLNNVRLVGAGKSGSGTMLRGTFAAGDAITFDGCQACEVSGVRFWPTVRKTDGFEVTLTGGCFDTLIDIRCDYGWNGLNINGATETRYKVNSRYMLGTIGVRFGGTVTHGSYRAICLDQISDNPYPVAATAANAKTWSSGMALTAGDHFVSGGAVWQCTGSGNASTVAPSGYPAGTSPDSVFSTSVSHGTATIRWICNESLSHIVMDSYAYSFVIASAALINGMYGFRMVDSANTGTSYPIWIFANNFECDHNRAQGVDLARGEGFFDSGTCWIGSCLTGNGVFIDANYRGNVSFGAGSRIMGNAQYGILRQAGPTDIRISGSEITDNSALSSGTYHGLAIAGGAVDTQVIGGRFGDGISVAGNNQGYGISIGNACDKTTIIGANVRGNATGAISVGSSQTNLHIADCPGYSPGSLAAITVTASPFSYTNSTGSDLSVNVVGGTVSSITLDTYTVATATNEQIIVPRGSVLITTYSAAPTMFGRIL